MIEQGIVSLSCLPMRARAGGRRHAEGCKYIRILVLGLYTVYTVSTFVRREGGEGGREWEGWMDGWVGE